MNQISNLGLLLVFLGGLAAGWAISPRTAHAGSVDNAAAELKRIADAVNKYVDKKLHCE